MQFSFAGEVPRVLFLGICLDFYSLVIWIASPKPCFYLCRRTVTETLVEPGLVPPRDPLKRRDLNINHVSPRPPMNKLIFVTTVDVLGHSIVVGVTDCPSRGNDSMLSKALIINNAHILRAVVWMVNQSRCFLCAYNRLVECLQGQRFRAHRI